MTTNRNGSVYLAASSEGDMFSTMAQRALAAVPTVLGKRRPKVAVSYAAAADSLAGRTYMKGYAAKTFWGAEIHAFHVPGEPSKMDVASAKRVVEEADLIFLSGGDPVLGARLLRESGADGWLRDARARGTSLLGISAGSIMLSAWWGAWPDPLPADHETRKWGGGALVPCAAVVPDLVVDCHAEEDDWEELKIVHAMLKARAHDALQGDAPLPRCIGLHTGRGVVVGPDGALTHLGGPPFAL